MGTAAILTLILPYLPQLLEFLAGRLDRTIPELIDLLDKHLGQPLPPSAPKSEDQIVLEATREIVGGVYAAHEGWTDEDKDTAAIGGLRLHLANVHHITRTDEEIVLLVKLYAMHLRAQQNAG